MPDSDPTTHVLDVPGARLYHERRGNGPLLLLIGSPMDSTGFAPLASTLADHYTVVTYDPHGIANSSREDTTQDVTPTQQADDVHRQLSALGGGPADVFGSSGGAVVGLALVTAHPDQVRTLVAHEPPVVELLADTAQLRAEIDDIYDTYRVEGAEKAMQKFMTHAGLGAGPAREADAPRWEPSPEQLARMQATTEHFLAHLLRPTTRYRPDIKALRAASTRIVVAGGATSKGQLANRTAVALADQLGTRVVDFPVTTADSWPSRSSSAADWTRCSPRRPEPAATLQARGRVAGAVRLHARLRPAGRSSGPVSGWIRRGCLEVRCG
jgi:clorobiocin/coumermycin A biosynthesis protein CloN7/CouN7